MPSTVFEHATVLLTAQQLSDDEARTLLAPIGFADWRAALRLLRSLSPDEGSRVALAGCLSDLLQALSVTGNPDRALSAFERFAAVHEDRPALYDTLTDQPRSVETLVTVFSGSQFLTEILFRQPAYLAEVLTDFRRLAEQKSEARFDAEAAVAFAAGAASTASQGGKPLDALRRFQRRELLRIGACDLLGLFDMPTVAAQLSHLADSLIRACLTVAETEAGVSTDGFVVLAMGKLGGEELNYSSDVDLLFVAMLEPTAYLRLAERLIDALTRATDEGFLYRVDMRLRPWGSSGALVSSLDGHIRYLAKPARLWEKQALLKARVVAGDVAVGADFLRRAQPFLFGLDRESIRADVHAMKQRTEAFLHEHGRDWGEVKLGEGSIRDVEFVAQFLQLVHGAEHPEVRSRNTLDALARLHHSGFLPPDEYRVLVEGYTFLRTVEHYLQMLDYRQTYTLPNDRPALRQLARRLAFRGADAGERLVARYLEHSAAIRAVYRRYLEAETMETKNRSDSAAVERQTSSSPADRHVGRMGQTYAARFTATEIARHSELAGLLNDSHLVEVVAAPLAGPDDRWLVTIVGYDYLGVLSLICGLLFAYGFNIHDGDSFTYEPAAEQEAPGTAEQPSYRPRRGLRLQSVATPGDDRRQKIVDVFTVSPVLGAVADDLWARYAADLGALFSRLKAGEQREAQGELVRRVAAALHHIPGASTALYPVDIEIDNDTSERYTVLRIDTPDTIGFLYEFTNALALNGIYIARMTVDTAGNRVRDVFYVTDTRGQKITAPERQRELRAATVLVKHFTHLLPHSPNPESALVHFGEFLGQLFRNPTWPDDLSSLERPEVLHALAHLLGVSEFLWDDFLRMQYTNLFPVVADVDALGTHKSKDRLRAELDATLRAASGSGHGGHAEQVEVLNAFKDREMFRIDMRHIQGLVPRFGQFSGELADLAEVVVAAAYGLCYREGVAEFGVPLLEDGGPCPISLCALGKVGGRELGYASDIELMFVYVGAGQTSGPKTTSTAEFYEKLVQEFVRTIQARREGIFQVDLQLRPYGKAGSMAVSLDSFRRYFAPGGPAWAYERQALVKLRPIAGDPEFGREIVSLRDEYAYAEPFDVVAMRGMRERQVRHLVAGGTINAKYSPGGLVDVEYLVQGLQITYGRDNPALRLTNTREAMTALGSAGILTSEEFLHLRDAHRFLRRLIDALRMVRGNAKDLTVPPVDDEEFAFLARRLGYEADVARLHADLMRHFEAVQELSTKKLG